MLTKQELDIQELMLLNSELRNREKSLGLCYLMLLGGHLGLHRFYVKRIASAVAQLFLFLFTIAMYIGLVVADIAESDVVLVIFLVLFFLSALGLSVWVIVDIFLIPRMIREWNAREEQQLLQEIWRIRHRKAQETL
ncbi:NINE protein [Gorillibacterium timonense]|uniref:NINE protein n=1 Tax=Gorillibacterium timonense TaxID=1689269 RepID=UPI00071CBC0E|nr:NINE protein [Gorillibacterium timonense]